ncbi:hypothetical protein OF83DRAFT_1110221 [Amylostereum chailletii]|nr:hypothetical protein OF83DRAFT_1110221 [Amylostereum chailletii]
MLGVTRSGGPGPWTRVVAGNGRPVRVDPSPSTSSSHRPPVWNYAPRSCMISTRLAEQIAMPVLMLERLTTFDLDDFDWMPRRSRRCELHVSCIMSRVVSVRFLSIFSCAHWHGSNPQRPPRTHPCLHSSLMPSIHPRRSYSED